MPAKCIETKKKCCTKSVKMYSIYCLVTWTYIIFFKTKWCLRFAFATFFTLFLVDFLFFYVQIFQRFLNSLQIIWIHWKNRRYGWSFLSEIIISVTFRGSTSVIFNTYIFCTYKKRIDFELVLPKNRDSHLNVWID